MKWSTNYITEEKRGNGETARMKWHIIVHIYTCRLMYHMMCNYNQFIYFYFFSLQTVSISVYRTIKFVSHQSCNWCYSNRIAVFDLFFSSMKHI